MRVLNFTVYAFLRGMLFLVELIPLRLMFWEARWAARLAYRLAKRRRALMLYNLELAFGDELTPEERERIARESLESLFLSMVELVNLNKIYRHWRDHFTLEGDEIIDRMIEEGRGFIVFGGHFGMWTSMAPVVMRFPDLPGFNIVARPLRNPYMQNLIEYLAVKYHGKIVTTRGKGKVIAERANNGELIGFYMDQEARRKQGIFVNFFGVDALTFVAPGHLAWKHDIPLIPYWLYRTKPGHAHVVFREPLDYELTDDPAENDRRVTQAIADEVERTVRERPEQWLWAHNRWRRRPDGTKVEDFEKKKKGYSRSGRRKKGEYLSSEDFVDKD